MLVITSVSVEAGRIDVSTGMVVVWGSVCVMEMYRDVVSVQAGKIDVSVGCGSVCVMEIYKLAVSVDAGKKDVSAACGSVDVTNRVLGGRTEVNVRYCVSCGRVLVK